MRTVTLQQLIQSAQRYADMENSSFISNTEWIDYINNAATKYWNLINSVVQDYNLVETTFVLESGTQDYQLPDDFLYMRGVDVNVNPSPPSDDDNWITVERYMYAERNVGKPYAFYRYPARLYLRYHIQTNILRFEPYPSGYQLCRIGYIPVMPNLQSADNTIDGINGFDDYIAMKAAIRALMKEETDTSALKLDVMEFEQQLKMAANDRNRDQADRVQDIYVRNSGYYW